MCIPGYQFENYKTTHLLYSQKNFHKIILFSRDAKTTSNTSSSDKIPH